MFYNGRKCYAKFCPLVAQSFLLTRERALGTSCQQLRTLYTKCFFFKKNTGESPGYERWAPGSSPGGVALTWSARPNELALVPMTSLAPDPFGALQQQHNTTTARPLSACTALCTTPHQDGWLCSIAHAVMLCSSSSPSIALNIFLLPQSSILCIEYLWV